MTGDETGLGGLSTDETGLGGLSTEAVRPELAGLDLLDTAALVALLAVDSRRATEAVVAAGPSISAAVELVVGRLAAGGRLLYVGAGTAGRLAALDAAELGPTFDVPAGVAVALLAGGDAALRRAVEGAEDDRAGGAEALQGLAVSDTDAVIGVSASGRTPFVLGAMERAAAAGAATIGVASNAGSALAALVACPVELVVGGEVVAGSSRLNAGTAQKIALNTISTAAMIRLGKTYGNLMVDVRATNAKLRDRAVRIVDAVTGVGPERALEALESAGWSTKVACLVAAAGLDVASAIRVLEEAGGRLRQALALAGASAGSPATGLAQRAGAGWAPRWKRLGVGAALVEGVLIRGDVAIEDGKVVAVGLPGAGSGVAIAGMVDLQVNGYAGVDAASASLEELETMGAALAADGVLAYQPTLISGDPEGTAAAVRRIGELAGRAGVAAARILGIHLEGPFLSPKRRGTHPLERLSQPDSELLERLLAAGPVTMVTIAPELGGAIPMIAALHRRGVVVSLGHSDASPAEASAAATAGASVVTHLYNGMAPISSRAAGLAGWALGDRRVGLQLIADGVHVADELLTIAVDAGPERVSLVTDATSVAGCSDGQMMLGDVPIELSRGVARGPDGTIAGGASRLIDGMRRLAGLSTSLEIALAAVTERPARILGRRDVGHLRPGAAADVVVLDDALQLRDVFVEGRSIHE